MKAPISYFGGKSRIASLIAAALPAHDTYIEPFCGSAAVFFAKNPVNFELLNDVDGELVNFFRVLRDQPLELLAVCEATPYARDEFRAALVPAADPLERARRFWVRSSQSYAGRINTHDSWSASRESSTSRPHTVRNRLRSFPMWAERLTHAAIENLDAVDVVHRYAGVGAVVYADPPYLHEARADYHRSNGYRHEYGTEEEHRRLAAALHGCDAAVLVSGYAHPLYEELYGGWSRLEVPISNNVQKRKKGEKRSRTIEVLWSNRPLLIQERLGVLA